MVKTKPKKKKPSKAPITPELRLKEFVDNYVQDFNASRAYGLVFGLKNEDSCCSLASRYLADDRVRQYLHQVLKERREALHLDTTYVVRKLTSIVETDYTQSIRVMTEEQLKAMPEGIRKLVQGVKLKKKTWLSGENNDEEVTEEYEVTFMSKDKALEALGRHTGTFMKDNIKGNVNMDKMSYTDMILAMSELPDDAE